jgi:adenosine deaminase
MIKNILVSTLGANASIIEETIGYINFTQFDFYANNKHYVDITKSRVKANLIVNPADELWLIATDRKSYTNQQGKTLPSTIQDFENIKRDCRPYVNKIKIFILKDVSDITNEIEATQFRDLTLKVVATAKEQTQGGKLYLSLACGRKTMSADMQEAAYCFGCDALLHVLGDNKEEAFPLNLGITKANDALSLPNIIFDDNEIIECKPNTNIVNSIKQQQEATQNFYTTYFLNDSRTNFPILYTLSKNKIEKLKCEKIGYNKNTIEQEFSYLMDLPKTDLHCHLGGVLDAKGLIEVAKCYIPDIENAKLNNPKFSRWIPNYSQNIPFKTWYNNLSKELNVHKGLIVSSFVLTFEGKEDELDKLIFDTYTNPEKYTQIGIVTYEKLGDLQGSALLCHESAIRKTVQILLSQCKQHNVRYIEIRCSPINYQTKDLAAKQILTAIFEELEKEKDIKASVIVIASRHGDETKIEQSIQLMQDLKNDTLFKKYFRGFDLAGDEKARSPKEMHSLFLDVMKDCYNITIHAGETAPVENVWEAVYYLNAERVGHGLKLIDNPDLMDKFLQRGIGIEMCPSSNFQIVGFKDNILNKNNKQLERYPLKDYLEKELLVSVNTDNPGISRTNATKELLKAAQLTQGGLSKWEILQIIYNGFKTSFYPYQEKKQLIKETEQYLKTLIEDNKL